MFLEKKCVRCRKLFTNKRSNGDFLSPKQFDEQNFCSPHCWSDGQKGKKLSEAHKRKLSTAKHLKVIVWYKSCKVCNQVFCNPRKSGMALSVTQFKRKSCCSVKCAGFLRRKHQIGYRALHYWVQSRMGKPDTCENCKKSGLKGRAIHWSNKSGVYNRNQNDWQRLCARCHCEYDKKLRLKIKERKIFEKTL